MSYLSLRAPLMRAPSPPAPFVPPRRLQDDGMSSLETEEKFGQDLPEARKASDAYVNKVKARLNAVDGERTNKLLCL